MAASMVTSSGARFRPRAERYREGANLAYRRAVRPAESIEAYRRSPEGTYVAGPTFLHLCWAKDAFATYLWGRPSVDDARLLVEALYAEMLPHASPHVSYGDLSGLEVIDPEAFAVVASYLVSVHQISSTKITAQTVVYGTGLAASVAAGFFTTYGATFPYRAFADAAEAATWLGVPADALASWQSLRREVAACSAELAELRTWLSTHWRDATLDAAATALGVSERTLQRRLRDARTSFRKELDEARLARARTLLLTRDDKLASVADELGFASHQHFSDWFRKLEGLSPSEYRATRRV